jgi:hypothetical protein
MMGRFRTRMGVVDLESGDDERLVELAEVAQVFLKHMADRDHKNGN